MREYEFFNKTICLVVIGWFVTTLIFLCVSNNVLSFASLVNLMALNGLGVFVIGFLVHTSRKNYITKIKEKYGAQLNKDFTMNSINVVENPDGSESYVLTYAEEDKNTPKLFNAEEIK